MVADHKPHLVILGAKSGIPSIAAARMLRLAYQLSVYMCELVLKPTSNQLADGSALMPYWLFRNEYSIERGCITLVIRVVVPTKL